MKAVVYETFGGPLAIRELPDPVPRIGGVVLEVRATGLCRSDWHGWVGHDPSVRLPHVPGHEMAGIVAQVGPDVARWQVGDRVTLPFVCGCGECAQCRSGNHQVCDHQFQPGFTHWGSFAQRVAIDFADANLVPLPSSIDDVTAASLGCRFATSFRAVAARGAVRDGQWVAVHGCGGVGLAAIMIAKAFGARVVAVDIDEEKLQLARSLGAGEAVNASLVPSVVEAVREVTNGGAHLSLDALGNPQTCFNSVANLRKRGRHVQIGLMVGEHRHPGVPMDLVVANELEIVGSHGMQAHAYGQMIEMIDQGRLSPEKLIRKRISLEESIETLRRMDRFESTGITVIDRFD